MILFFSQCEDMIEIPSFRKNENGIYLPDSSVWIPSGEKLHIHELPREYFVKKQKSIRDTFQFKFSFKNGSVIY